MVKGLFLVRSPNLFRLIVEKYSDCDVIIKPTPSFPFSQFSLNEDVIDKVQSEYLLCGLNNVQEMRRI